MVNELLGVALWIIIAVTAFCACWWLSKFRCGTRERQAGPVVHQTIERRSASVCLGKSLELGEWILFE